jgi:hypothetical protein
MKNEKRHPQCIDFYIVVTTDRYVFRLSNNHAEE